MDSRAYVEERYSGTTLFYSFIRWLMRWKWVLLGIGAGLTVVLLGLNCIKYRHSSYSIRLTENMLPKEVVSLPDVYSILSVKLQNPEEKYIFGPRIVESKVKLSPGSGPDGKGGMLDVSLILAETGNVDTISKSLEALIFDDPLVKAKLLQRREVKKAEIEALDTLIAQTKKWIDFEQTNKLAAGTDFNRLLNEQATRSAVGLLLNEMNSFVLKKAQLQSELHFLSREQLTLGDVHEQKSNNSASKLMLKIVAVWVVFFLVSLLVWFLLYSYEVSETASQWQRRGALEGEVRKE